MFFFLLNLFYIAQYDDELISNENSSIVNDLITKTINENDRTIMFDSNQMNISTQIPDIISSDGTYQNSYSSGNDFDVTTSPDRTKLFIEEQWFNLNQSYRRDSLAWRRTYGK